MKYKLRFLIIAITSLSLGKLFAQPANDTPCTAQSITIDGGCISGDNTGANADGYTGSCWLTTASHTVWYSFVATNDTLTFSTDYAATTLTDSQIAIYSSSTGTCSGTFSQVGCDEDGGTVCNLCSEITLTSLVVGNTYFLAVDGYSNNVGTFCISISEPIVAAPDFGTCCDLAHQLYPNTTCSVTSGNIGSATGMTSACSVDQGCSAQNDATQPGFWSTFTANSTSTTIDPVDFTGPTTSNWYDVSVYTGSCGSLTQVDCRSVPSKDNNYAITTTVGTTYYVFMTQGSNYTSATPILQLCLLGNACTAPSNNACSSATSVTDGVVYSGTVACATADLALCSGSTENNVWYSWTAPSTWVSGNSAFIFVYNQDCYDLDPGDPSPGLQVSVYLATETCATISGGTSECIVYINPASDENFYGEWLANPNQTYLINIDGFGGDACTFDLLINDIIPVNLPINLLSFKAIPDNLGKAVHLYWTTMSEENNATFIVERSKNSLQFEPVLELDGKGTTHEIHNYHEIDVTPLEGMSYYRLKQIDYDGKVSYSSVVPVRLNLEIETKLSPNPAMSLAYLEVVMPQESIVALVLTDMSGRQVLNQRYALYKGYNKIEISLNKVSNGIYNVTLLNEDGTLLNTVNRTKLAVYKE